MRSIDALRDLIAEPARDISLNLQSTLTQGALTDDQRWGVALAAAITVGEPRLMEAVRGDAGAVVSEAVIDDARAAAALMAMNNVYYRFRHMVKQPVYSQKPARLRMQRIARPATNKGDFELMCLAVSAMNGCEVCVQSHEASVREHGLTEEHVHDAVRLAATIAAVGTALRI